MKTTYSQRYTKVITNGTAFSRQKRLEHLAQLIYSNDRTQSKKDCVWQAIEEFESMTEIFVNPTQDVFEEIMAAII